jgi:Arc/MetJ-type ribon-helix-helix transcriptional regulator
MDRTALPAELAHFVQQALARGTYQSEEELMAEAVRLLKASGSRQEAVQQPNGSTKDTPPQTPDEYVQAIAQALDTGDPVRARTLALAGAEHYPQHTELRTYAQVLAPPTATVVPATPASRAAVTANHAWLTAHWEAYRGHWIALRAGQLLHASPSLEDVVAHVGEVRGRGILLTKIPA